MTDQELIEKLKGITNTTEDGELINAVLYDRMITADNETTHGVYVQINLDSYVTAVDSDAFIPDLSNWIKVDEGRGELYKYARVNYCPKGLQTDGGWNYKLVDGVVVYAPQQEQPEDHNEMASQEEFFIASRKYNVGELISIQGRMYEVISIILAGGKINPGSNVREITLEQYINKKVEEATP
ncbi:MAG: hypothetical protein IKF48_04230 [Oscillospiraceae bacterium]|nr:hypothetical protein [Oscillospiraceae bacterium]